MQCDLPEMVRETEQTRGERHALPYRMRRFVRGTVAVQQPLRGQPILRSCLHRI
ncbi:hypothetical protein DPMN_016398 [Dreissena polymorpha]|uniref:Uncharacterized protein n=1 Tax=Dreissena polymorpha TaxID=45954 RepID=A0A9D4ND28_DREPO|nr:hypothetical protein DPMN_016398 [Dreissena polymorpha]